jgi:lipid II:glycine glycyltransferase (peptidoglycan interpeptide bridge formation enzyme)
MVLKKGQFNKDSVHPLQSWEWGEFREAWGNKVVRLDKFQIILSIIPHTNFTIGGVVRGPEPSKEDIKEIIKVAKENNAIFVKFEPNVLTSPNLEKKMRDLGLIKGKRFFTRTSFWIDLTPTEDELLKSFSPKTRYNIRLAEKRGVTVKEDNSDTAFRKYLALTKETTRRQHFYAHSQKYHELMWKFLNPAGIAHLLTATFNKEIITTWILFSWHNFLYYPYGASTEKYKNVMANNLMMWEAMKFGKKLGLTTFDLWGREEGKGFTKFKEGYNPKVVEFIGTWDLVVNKPLYFFYAIADKIRWFFLRIK